MLCSSMYTVKAMNAEKLARVGWHRILKAADPDLSHLNGRDGHLDQSDG